MCICQLWIYYSIAQRQNERVCKKSCRRVKTMNWWRISLTLTLLRVCMTDPCNVPLVTCITKRISFINSVLSSWYQHPHRRPTLQPALYKQNSADKSFDHRCTHQVKPKHKKKENINHQNHQQTKYYSCVKPRSNSLRRRDVWIDDLLFKYHNAHHHRLMTSYLRKIRRNDTLISPQKQKTKLRFHEADYV